MTEYPWFKHYDAGVPRTLEPYSDKTLFEDVADVAKERPGHRPEGGTVSQLAHPIKYSATPPVYRRTGVSAGTHTQDVLREIGFAEDEVKEFEKTGLFS
jgi:crotonobetainyl-CoA:carnitine CoA-transferase CaiB-like acyl-CoA transferase